MTTDIETLQCKDKVDLVCSQISLPDWLCKILNYICISPVDVWEELDPAEWWGGGRGASSPVSQDWKSPEYPPGCPPWLTVLCAGGKLLAEYDHDDQLDPACPIAAVVTTRL